MTTTYVDTYVEVIEPRTEIVPAGPQLDALFIERARAGHQQRRAAIGAIFDAIWAAEYGSAEKEQWADYWDDELERWLTGQASPHTQRAYRASITELRRHMRDACGIRYLWMVQPYHITQWIQTLRAAGSLLAIEQKPLKERTIARHLAACSSYYKHMCDCTQLVEGEQVGLFVSRSGNPLPNPFASKTVKRPDVDSYSDSKAIPTPAMRWILDNLATKENKSLSDYRDYALLLTFYRTGYRADSVLSMRWKDFSERSDGADGAIFAWRGKGNKSKNKAMPPMIYDAIVAWLRAAGRWVPGHPLHVQPDDYIWQPIRVAGCANFMDITRLETNRHITQSTANGILQRHLRNYYEWRLSKDKHPKRTLRVEAQRLAKQYHLHSLRHTFASELAEASGDNILLVQELLDHESPETTRIYIKAIKNPQDKASALLQQMFGY